MGNSAAHGWRGRWTENVKERGMERGDVKNEMEGAVYPDYSLEVTAIRPP